MTSTLWLTLTLSIGLAAAPDAGVSVVDTASSGAESSIETATAAPAGTAAAPGAATAVGPEPRVPAGHEPRAPALELDPLEVSLEPPAPLDRDPAARAPEPAVVTGDAPMVPAPVAEVLAEIPQGTRGLGHFAWLFVSLLVVFRGGSRLLSRRLSERRRSTLLLRRVWPIAEVAAWVVVLLFLVVDLLGRRTELALWGLAAIGALAIAVWWQPLKDLAAGIVFLVERPFAVGDVVRIGSDEGQVRRLRLRLVELETAEGRLVLVPYRSLGTGTALLSLGGRTAHAVRIELELPADLSPQVALQQARELAASSPWSMLGAVPRVRILLGEPGRRAVEVEAYAIDRPARAALVADLVSGWKGEAKAPVTESPAG
ncbi:MAG: mechanosensitive ion channel [Deltaproteobacteria bacterium]|nr:mechanosensitive ion channel [Deltaproteobacteria bacterium]